MMLQATSPKIAKSVTRMLPQNQSQKRVSQINQCAYCIDMHFK
ncbi:MAG: hypothetical protein IH901_04545 [Proteobacteria bacterium]|nr:hypothetical protein [Pseudomonadota bacterium]